jgi:predicted CoA-binding protein
MAKPSVAIIGASEDRSKYGNKSIRAHLQQGYDVFPVNPKGGMIEGLPVSATISDVPVDSLDRVSMYVPPNIGLSMLDAIVSKGCREFWLNPGSESDQLIEAARALGLDPIIACSIVDVGLHPGELGE